MNKLHNLLLHLRPAFLGSLVASLFRLNKRRLVRTTHGTFFINPISNFGSIVLESEYELPMRNVLTRYLSSGGVFIDLGANEGYFSVLASQLVGPKGTVIAIEPQSRLQNVIQINLAANDCFNVRVIKCVVSDNTGIMTLSLAPSQNTGSSSLFPQVKYPLSSEIVRSLCLSDLLDKLGLDRCDLMKVDIEGAEYDVFMPAAEVLRKGVIKHLAIEIHNSVLRNRGLCGDDLHRHMIENGYTLNEQLGPWVYSWSGVFARTAGL